MTVKMLAGFAGIDFSASPGDVTDRFSEAEEGRLVEAGFAELAAEDYGVKKPATSPTRKPRRAS